MALLFEIWFRLRVLSRASGGRSLAHRSADADASGGPSVRLNVLGLSLSYLFHDYNESKCLFGLSVRVHYYDHCLYWLFDLAGECDVKLPSLRCIELLYRPAVNACPSLYILYCFFVALFLVILNYICLINTLPIIHGDVLCALV